MVISCQFLHHHHPIIIWVPVLLGTSEYIHKIYILSSCQVHPYLPFSALFLGSRFLAVILFTICLGIIFLLSLRIHLVISFPSFLDRPITCPRYAHWYRNMITLHKKSKHWYHERFLLGINVLDFYTKTWEPTHYDNFSIVLFLAWVYPKKTTIVGIWRLDQLLWEIFTFNQLYNK